MIIGFTGTRNEVTEYQKDKLKEVLSEHTNSTFHHGDCVGADETAHNIARDLGYEIEVHPPVNNIARAFCKGYNIIHQPKNFLSRNRDIVDSCRMLIACPNNYVKKARSGTWYTIDYAQRNAIPTLIIYPGDKE